MARLIDCVFRNDIRAASVLTSQQDEIDERDDSGRTALIHAAIDGKLPFIELLIESGADVNARDESGYSPLHYAAQGQFVDIAKLLIANGARVDAEDTHGNTPLARAVFSSNGRGELIGILLHAGADPRHANKHGQTPAGLASMIGNYDVKQYFD